MKKLSKIMLCLILISLVLITGCATKEQTQQDCKGKCYETAKKDFNATSISASQIKIAYDKMNNCLKNCQNI